MLAIPPGELAADQAWIRLSAPITRGSQRLHVAAIQRAALDDTDLMRDRRSVAV